MTDISPTSSDAAPARPSRWDEAIKRAAAEATVETMIRSGSVERGDADDAVEAVLMAARHSLGCGYKMAVEMERLGWSADATMVADLDEYEGHISSAHDAAVREWVIAHGIIAPLPVGQRVSWPMGFARKEGVIDSIDTAMARYRVIMDGDVDGATGSRRYLVAYDQAAVVEPAPADQVSMSAS